MPPHPPPTCPALARKGAGVCVRMCVWSWGAADLAPGPDLACLSHGRHVEGPARNLKRRHYISINIIYIYMIYIHIYKLAAVEGPARHLPEVKDAATPCTLICKLSIDGDIFINRRSRGGAGTTSAP